MAEVRDISHYVENVAEAIITGHTEYKISKKCYMQLTLQCSKASDHINLISKALAT